MRSALAAQAGVDPSAVDLIISAGSIIADVRIETHAVTAASVQSTMARATSSPSSASAMLASVTSISVVVLAVVTTPTVEEVPPPPPPSPSPPPPMSPIGTGAVAAPTVESSGGSMGIIIGVVVGVSIAFVLALVFMRLYCCNKNETIIIIPPPPGSTDPPASTTNEIEIQDIHELLRRIKSQQGHLNDKDKDNQAERELRAEAEKKLELERKRNKDLEEQAKTAEEQAKTDLYKSQSLPGYWDNDKDKSAKDGFAAIALDKNDPTFAALGRFLETDKAKLKKSGADRSGTSHDTLKLACAWRLENPLQWRAYMSKVQKVGKEMERIQQAGVKPAGGAPVMTGGVASSLPGLAGQLRANVNEAFLMHGTGADAVLDIISDCFNERLSSGLFGQGTYLAEDAGKCDQYTKMDLAGGASDLHKRLYSPSVPHPGKVFYIFVCRVAQGYYMRTRQTHGDEKKPFKSADTDQPIFPKWNDRRELSPVLGIPAPHIPHHSLLADVLHIFRYREFVVFHGDYIYPEYLLAYQRFESGVWGSLKGPYDGISP